jgi:hypothetical protein
LADLNAQADLSCNDLGVNINLNNVAGHETGVYTPGCYSSSGTMDITLNTTVTLNGAGTYIFRSGGALTTGTNSAIVLTGGASAGDVFWVSNGHVVIGANSSTSATSTFAGNILQNSLAAFDVTIGHFVNLLGRVMAYGRTVTTDSVTITVPDVATLRVIKEVVNDNNGSAIASDFTAHVKLSGAEVLGSPAAGVESPGRSYSLAAGTYVVSEDANVFYDTTFSGDCDENGTVTISSGGNYTCTITNNDIGPQLIVNKIVINDSGATKTISNFQLLVDGTSVSSGVATTTTVGLHTVSETADFLYGVVIGGDCAANGTITLALGDVKTCTVVNDDVSTAGGGSIPSVVVPPLIDLIKVPSPLALPDGPGPVTYTYTLRNIGAVPVTDITMVGDTCSPIGLVSGDANADAKLDVDETWVYNCFTTLSETHTNIVTATGWANGISATDIANATVVVGVPVIPPLIHVTKIPNPLLLSAGEGTIVYTNKVTNPGAVALSNVRLVDDKCGPVAYVSGDANGDAKLDVAETWTYACQMKLTETMTNTVTATGEANGLTAKDFAIATVIVSAPKLPNTGFFSDKNDVLRNIMALAGIFAVLIAFYFARKKQII